MAKVRTVFRCPECGASAPKWVGQCPGCQAWGTLVEELLDPRFAYTATSEEVVTTSATPTPATKLSNS